MPLSGKPSTGDHGARRRSPRTFWRSSTLLWSGLGVVALVQVFFSVPRGRTLTYSEFKAMVRAGQVSDVEIGEKEIVATLKASDPRGGPLRVARVDDPGLVQELEVRNVQYRGAPDRKWVPQLL